MRLRLLRKRRRHDMTLRIIERLVAPGDAVVDVGAYRGVYTLSLARRVGPSGHVWAIEPFPPNFAALRRVCRRLPNVTPCPWAAGDHPGTQELVAPVYRGARLGALATLGHSPVPGASVSVEVRTLDDLLDLGGGRTRAVTFVRCDVVGHEVAVLEGAERTIAAHHPSLLVEIEQRHQEGDIRLTLERVAGAGYEVFFVRGQHLHPVAGFDLQRDQLSFLGPEFVPYGMPAGYVHYFLFVPPGTDLSGLVAPTGGRSVP